MTWRASLMMLGILALASTAVAQRPAVVVHATLDADQISDAGTVRVWVVVDNQGANPIDTVRFDALQLHGFEPVPGCWIGNAPACASGSNTPDRQDSVAASSQLVRWAEFKRVQKDNGRSVLFGAVRWNVPAEGRTYQATITAPPLQLVSATRPLSTTELLAFITLLGTAITMAVQLIIQRRTEKQTLFTTLLPKNLKNSESYYLPLQSTIDRISALAEASPASSDELTFNWFGLSRRMRHLNQRAGGFYFKSHLGEELASRAWDQFKLLEVARKDETPPIDRALMFQVVGQLEPTSNFGEFKSKCDTDANFKRDVLLLQAGFDQWRKTTSWVFALTCIGILNEVLGFEINRPHELWYVDAYAGEAHIASLKAHAERLRRLNLGGVTADEESRDELDRLVRDYLNRSWGEGGVAPGPAMPR